MTNNNQDSKMEDSFNLSGLLGKQVTGKPYTGAPASKGSITGTVVGWGIASKTTKVLYVVNNESKTLVGLLLDPITVQE